MIFEILYIIYVQFIIIFYDYFFFLFDPCRNLKHLFTKFCWIRDTKIRNHLVCYQSPLSTSLLLYLSFSVSLTVFTCVPFPHARIPWKLKITRKRVLEPVRIFFVCSYLNLLPTIVVDPGPLVDQSHSTRCECQICSKKLYNVYSLSKTTCFY